MLVVVACNCEHVRRAQADKKVLMEESNIAVFFRGPIRPSVEAVTRNIVNLVGNLRDMGFLPFTYLMTWADVDANDLSALLAAAPIDAIMTVRPFSNVELEQITGPQRFPLGGSPVNALRQYYMSAEAIRFISSDWRYRHIVHSRTDLAVKLAGPADQWFNDHYCTIHSQLSHWGRPPEESFINDQFAVAPRHLMRAAWDYGTVENLAEMIGAAVKAEDVLQAMLDRAGIVPAVSPVEEWALDPNRFVTPA